MDILPKYWYYSDVGYLQGCICLGEVISRFTREGDICLKKTNQT